ncbi:MAG: porin family protein [Myxococcales bacterium]|nr:porin family protein [Myxococcales bacterium]
MSRTAKRNAGAQTRAGRSPLRPWLGIGLLAALVATAAPGRAETPGEPDYARTGFHLGLGGAYAFENFDYDIGSLDVETAFPPGSSGIDPGLDDSAGIDVRIGYRLHERYDLALLYEWLEGFDSTRTSPPLELDTHLLTLDSRFFCLTGRTQPYALVGLGILIVNTEIVASSFAKPFDVNVGFAARFGAGVDFYLTRGWLFGLEGSYVVPTGPVEKADYGTLGFKFEHRF